MEMSREYMEKTVEHLRSTGFEVVERTEQKMRNDELVFDRHQYRCTRAPSVDLVLEALRYPDGHESYYMEVHKLGPMRSFSFPLDSWKFRPASVEFKYYIHPDTGLGLSFILDLSPEAYGAVAEKIESG